MAKFQLLTTPDADQEIWIFTCPGCEYGHSVRTKGKEPCWTWNGNPDSPTINPSLLCNKDEPERRCHSFIRDGNIQFLTDCYHKLAGQTVPIPDFNL